MNAAAQTPALLLMPEYNGTLAAARCLAGHSVPIVVAASNIWAPVRWSNAVTRVVPSPDFTAGPTAIVEWLLDYGKSQQHKCVLYPTCDELAWLLARFRDQLSEYFHMYSPALSALRTILDKRALYTVAAEAGLDTPRTWYPHSESELEEVSRQAAAFIVKPRSQTFLKSHAKGGVARNIQQLREVWTQYRADAFAAEVADDMTDVSYPMIQEFLPRASQHVYSISGFMGRDGVLLDCRASGKVLQLPKGAGIGVCFESVAPEQRLVELVAELCRRIGYFGVFEAEFIDHDGRWLLIDFNPRYFGQMGFDIARGMQLPWMAHLCALGQEAAAREHAEHSKGRHYPQRLYADSIALKWHLFTGSLFGAVPRQERLHWRKWLMVEPTHLVDAIHRPDDYGPSIASMLSRVWLAIRHPRGFLRSVRGNRA